MHATLRDAEKQRDKLPDREKAEADERISSISASYDEALRIFQSMGTRILTEDPFAVIMADGYEDNNLMTLVVLKELCDKQKWDGSCSSEFLSFLRHEDGGLLRRFLQAGGARHGAYPLAVQLFHQLLPMVKTQSDEYQNLFERLAMAVALELCDPVPYFHGNGKVEAIPRYEHYQNAFLRGELDPNFEFFSVWELRHVVNCDATNDELEWGRESLRNFRPGLVYLRDPKWRYCRIVKTDVPPRKPDWYVEPRSYDQILSGGGRCGPRAWYGRFICRAFGIPVWGAKQPGHAAVSSFHSHERL